MHLRLFICSAVLFWTVLPLRAQLYRAPAHAARAVYRSTLNDLQLLQVVPNSLSRQIYQTARARFEAPAPFMAVAPRGLVQVALPHAPYTVGSGFLFEEQGRLFVAMAYHVGGNAGSWRKVRLFTEDGLREEHLVQIGASGQGGWNEVDVSIAELPFSVLDKGALPLPLAQADLSAEAYSVGYTSGLPEMGEFLPMKRRFLSAEGNGLVAQRQLIPGENAQTPFLPSGYCGAPVLQQQQGVWKVVGVHAGSCVAPGQPEKNRCFAINTSRTIPLLVALYLGDDVRATRGVSFRGWPVARLARTERVQTVQVLRGGTVIFEQVLRNYPGPYADDHSELALADFDTHPGDVVRYLIGRSGAPLRQVDFVLP